MRQLKSRVVKTCRAGWRQVNLCGTIPTAFGLNPTPPVICDLCNSSRSSKTPKRPIIDEFEFIAWKSFQFGVGEANSSTSSELKIPFSTKNSRSVISYQDETRTKNIRGLICNAGKPLIEIVWRLRSRSFDFCFFLPCVKFLLGVPQHRIYRLSGITIKNRFPRQSVMLKGRQS